MSALLQRLFWGLLGDEMPVVQHLHRDLALFAESEWEWRVERDGAHVFATYQDAESAIACHLWTDGSGRKIRPYPVVRSETDVSALRRREEDHIAAAIAGFPRARRERATHHVSPEEAYANLQRRHLD